MSPNEPRPPARLQPALIDHVREAVHGQKLIAWEENDFAVFLALFDVINLNDNTIAQMGDGAIYVSGLREMLHLHAQRRTSHVLIVPLNENWGAFSTFVPHRTVNWGNWHADLANAGYTLRMVREYLDDPAVKAVVTTQHTVFVHSKIIPIPIGLNPRHHSILVDRLAHADGKKNQDLLLNNSGWEHRSAINERIVANFDGAVHNTYRMQLTDYFNAIACAKFVLCPSGFGWDTYRIWETLLLGSIPIVEYSAGWHTVLDDLPVLFVDNFDAVTPVLLDSAYPRIVAQSAHFNYAKLTTAWWQARILARLNQS